MWYMHAPASTTPAAQIFKNVYYEYFQLIMFSLVAITLQQGMLWKYYMYPCYIATDTGGSACHNNSSKLHN